LTQAAQNIKTGEKESARRVKKEKFKCIDGLFLYFCVFQITTRQEKQNKLQSYFLLNSNTHTQKKSLQNKDLTSLLLQDCYCLFIIQFSVSLGTSASLSLSLSLFNESLRQSNAAAHGVLVHSPIIIIIWLLDYSIAVNSQPRESRLTL